MLDEAAWKHEAISQEDRIVKLEEKSRKKKQE